MPWLVVGSAYLADAPTEEEHDGGEDACHTDKSALDAK